MSAKRSKYFDNCLSMVKNGYIEFAPDLIQNIQNTLKKGENLNVSQREYLMECFKNILVNPDKKHPADKAFYLKKKTKGAPKRAVGIRNQHAAMKMYEIENDNLSYEEKLEHVRDFINNKYSSNIEIETIAAAYTNYRKDNWNFFKDD